MGCASSADPPSGYHNKEGCSCFICADQSYGARHRVLCHKLSGITDLVSLVESYIPLDCPHIPFWYVNSKRKEFYQVKPRPMFGPVVWNYYATQHKGVALYVLVRDIHREAVWIDETRLKLQILDQFFKPRSHPKCIQGFRSILQNESVDPARFGTIVHHFHFWIKAFNLQIFNFSPTRLELEGFYPVIWIIFSFILRAKGAPLATKIQIIRFLVDAPYFCFSIKKNWAKLGGVFLADLAAPPLLRYTSFVDTLGEIGA